MKKTQTPHTPERTCLGCGKKQPKTALVRLVLDGGGGLSVDPAQRAQGRGAYLCGEGCLRGALKRKAFGRAFRGKAPAFDGSALSAALSGASGLKFQQFGLDAAPPPGRDTSEG